MSEPTARVWLNWELFEVAAISPLFTTDLNMERLRQLTSKFPDTTVSLTYAEWIEAAGPVFKLRDVQLLELYRVCCVLFTKDSLESLNQAQILLGGGELPPSLCPGVSDMLCLLYAFFIKKKCRSPAETAQFEQFPVKIEAARINPKQKTFAYSTPTLNRGLSTPIRPTPVDSNQSQQLGNLFMMYIEAFLKLMCGSIVKPRHVESLSSMVHCGKNYTNRARSMADMYGLFTNSDTEPIEKVLGIMKKSHYFSHKDQLKMEVCKNSPAQYRPTLLGRPAPPEQDERFVYDCPLLITDLSNANKVEILTNAPDVHVHNSRNLRLYLCGYASVVFLSNLKDSLVFVGSANFVRLDYCSNVTVVTATKLLHLDSCSNTKAFVLTPNEPLLTGFTTKTTLAPYNAIYTHFGLDILTAGISPLLNLFDKPVVLGTSGQMSNPVEIMNPEQFLLFVVPFTTPDQALLAYPLPQKYADALESKQQKLMRMKEAMDQISAKDPELAEQIKYQLRGRASKWIHDEGHMNEMKWLYSDF